MKRLVYFRSQSTWQMGNVTVPGVLHRGEWAREGSSSDMRVSRHATLISSRWLQSDLSRLSAAAKSIKFLLLSSITFLSTFSSRRHIFGQAVASIVQSKERIFTTFPYIHWNSNIPRQSICLKLVSEISRSASAWRFMFLLDLPLLRFFVPLISLCYVWLWGFFEGLLTLIPIKVWTSRACGDFSVC